MDIRDFFIYIKRKLWIVAAALVICTVLSAALTFINKPVYRTTRDIIVGPQTVVNRDDKFVNDINYVISDLVKDDTVLTKMTEIAGNSLSKDNMKDILTSGIDDVRQRVQIVVTYGNVDVVNKIASNVPQVIVDTAKQLFDVDNLIIVKDYKEPFTINKDYKNSVMSGAVSGIGIGLLIIFIMLLIDDKLRNKKVLQTMFSIDYLGNAADSKQGKDNGKDNSLAAATMLVLKAQDRNLKALSVIDLGLGNKGLYNIAAHMKELDRKVLVVEADKGSQAGFNKSGNNSGYGLTDILGNGKQDFSSAINKTEIGNVDIMHFGKNEEIKLSDMVSGNLRSLISSLKEKYDLVLFDMPLGSGLNKINAFTHACDGVVLSARENVTKIKDVERVLADLKYTKKDILGYYSM